jgi:uncharacterized RDD family membrane protein YckC
VSALPAEVRAAQGTSAGLVSRVVADVIDILFVTAAILLGYLGVMAISFVLRPRVFRWPEPSGFALSAVAALSFVLYLAVAWATTGRTLGKQVMGLRVVRSDRTGLSIWRSLARAVLCVVFPVGIAWSVVDRGDRAVHDVLLGTVVIYHWRRRSLVTEEGAAG